MKKAHAELAKAVNAAKQVVKLMGAAHVSKFEMDEMEREDMLDVLLQVTVLKSRPMTLVVVASSSILMLILMS